MISITRWQVGVVFDIELIDKRSGFIQFRAKGKNAKEIFKNETGGHRWQRIPPTEKRGRVHTSTITVAVMEDVNSRDIRINEKDLDWKFSRGSGAGGQHRNKTDTCVDLTHLPTGIKVRIDGRSQASNKQNALSILRIRIKEQRREQFLDKRHKIRKQQVGSGMRGDKIRTIRVRDDQVKDHRLGTKTTYNKYVRGDFSDLT